MVWPERDDATLERAQRHARLLAACGAGAVGIATLPETWPAGFQIGDALPPGAIDADVGATAAEAFAAARARSLPAPEGVRLAVPPLQRPPDAGAMFARATAVLARHLAEPQTTIDAVVLWRLHTWALHGADGAFDVSPRLVLQANDARADHARALRLIGWLTPTPLLVSRAIAAHLLPAIEADEPTLLMEDIAGGMLYRRDMRTLIAAGARRDGLFLTQRTKRNREGRASCFTPACIATTAVLPDDVRVRSIVVPMTPPATTVTSERLDLWTVWGEIEALRAEMQAFAGEATRTAPELEPLLRNFGIAARDNWRPILAIAHAIGARAVSRALEAASALSRSAPPPASNFGPLERHSRTLPR